MTASSRLIPLAENWRLQSTEKTAARGEAISSPGFDVSGWHPARVPSTVMGTLATDGTYDLPTLYMGRNLLDVPKEPFAKPWWYRTTFTLPAEGGFETVLLEFDGVIFRANAWLNGRKIADASTLFGTFFRHDFDITAAVNRKGENVLAVEVIPVDVTAREYSIDFCDWAPTPPDRNMGLWREVRIKLAGPVSVDRAFVRAVLDVPTFAQARLTVGCRLRNHSDRPVAGTLTGTLEGKTLVREIALKPREERIIEIAPADAPALVVANPRVWWPHAMGKPEMYAMNLRFETGGSASDVVTVPFGIRDMRTEREDDHEIFVINGRRILIRGAGWSDQLFMLSDPENLERQIEYVKHLNLNAIRLEAFWGTSQLLYDLCDRHGVLILGGLTCMWEWAAGYAQGAKEDPVFGCLVGESDMAYTLRHFRDQIQWLRNHPSIVLWLFSSDLSVYPELERRYLALLEEIDPGRPYFMNYNHVPENVVPDFGTPQGSNYDYVLPPYYHDEPKPHHTWGLDTEDGPGPQIPPLESLRKMIPADALWPQGEHWIAHCSTGRFGNLRRYNEAMDHRLGKPEDLEDYLRKAQFMNYEAIRAMFEAYASKQYGTTGMIAWMLNTPWPKVWWQMYDHYLMPNGAFYGTRKACEPLHIQYDYSARKVQVVNKTYRPLTTLEARIRVLNLDLRSLYEKTIPVSAMSGDEVRAVDTLPAEFAGVAPTHLLDLRLAGPDGVVTSINQYLLSTTPDEFDHSVTDHNDPGKPIPFKRYADLTGVNRLPPAKVTVDTEFATRGDDEEARIVVRNRGAVLAFNLDVQVLRDGTDESVKPLRLDDNFFSLLPGEERIVTARYAGREAGGRRPQIEVRAYNG